MRQERLYQRVIAWVNALPDEQVFSVTDIEQATGASRPQIRFVLQLLAYMGFLSKTKKAYRAKIWRRTKSWLLMRERIEVMYETYRRVWRGRQAVRLANATTGRPKGRS